MISTRDDDVRNNGTKETTPFHIFKDEVAKASEIPVFQMHLGRLHAAYDMGEAVWMVAEEMKLRAEVNMTPVKPYALPNLDKVCIRRIKV
jgi:hypothetical protein